MPDWEALMSGAMRETGDMTLVEFLLARIAEDEAVARKAQRGYQHVFGIPHYFTANGDTSVAMNPRVALAECEAKRRIVDGVGYHREFSGDVTPASDELGETALRALAVVYADHPEFRQEWRPV